MEVVPRIVGLLLGLGLMFLFIWATIVGVSLIVRLVRVVVRALVRVTEYLAPGAVFTGKKGGAGSPYLISGYGSVPTAGPPRVCANPKCRWVNLRHARFCAQCGQPLAASSGRKIG